MVQPHCGCGCRSLPRKWPVWHLARRMKPYCNSSRPGWISTIATSSPRPPWQTSTSAQQALDALTQLRGWGLSMLSSAKEHRHAIPTDRRAHDDGAPVWLRPACAADAAALVQLAELLDTMNYHRTQRLLPASSLKARRALPVWRMPRQRLLRRSLQRHLYARGHPGRTLARYGLAVVASRHTADPHYYLRSSSRPSIAQLNTERRLHLLRLERDDVPWTELGGLVVHPSVPGKAPRGRAPAPRRHARRTSASA